MEIHIATKDLGQFALDTGKSKPGGMTFFKLHEDIKVASECTVSMQFRTEKRKP